MNNIVSGRGHFFALCVDSGNRNRAVEAVDKCLGEMETFSLAWDMIHKGTKANYDFNKHDLEWCDEVVVLDRKQCSRDYIVNRVFVLAESLFPNEKDQDKKESVKGFLVNKLLKHGKVETLEDFKLQGNHENAEKSLSKLLTKVKKNEFLSADQKANKKRRNKSLYFRTNSLQKEITQLENDFKEGDLDRTSSEQKNIEQRIQEKKAELEKITENLQKKRTNQPSSFRKILHAVRDFFLAIGRFFRLVWEALFNQT